MEYLKLNLLSLKIGVVAVNCLWQMVRGPCLFLNRTGELFGACWPGENSVTFLTL